ncbi:OTU domain-containing protein 7B isoform X2 [Scleropages formosus]|uniref:OTU domain-containing protein 7B isoform X2 n=1 Tax=Scleropages formosus TaxID=113540 RepID=UPI0008780CCD|nr:OTU domain-containing protein 7B-like isoform X2 [Scleropages formosus]
MSMQLPDSETTGQDAAEKEMRPMESASRPHRVAGPIKVTPTSNSPISHGMAQTQISGTDGSGGPPLPDTALGTFHVPNHSMYPDDVWDFASDLIEQSTMTALENAGRLNWWTRVGASCQRLLPLVTRGDGNCLLHAASMSIWGIQDRDLTLRKSLHAQMDHGLKREALRRRWRWQQTQQNRELGLLLTEEEWQKEWNELLKLASSEPKMQHSGSYDSMQAEVKSSEMPIYESLEEFHVFVLAHVMRRPIIVVADTMLKDSEGEAFAPISFGGIYLPLEVPAIECQSTPLVLAYDNGHFSALAFIEQKDSFQRHAAIPLTDSEYNLLPIHFAVDPGEEWEWDKDNEKHLTLESVTLSMEAKLQLLHSYLNVIWLPLSHHWQQTSMTTAEQTAPTGDKDHKSIDSKLDAESVCSTCSGHLEVGKGDGGAEASESEKTNVGSHSLGFPRTGPHCKKGKQMRQVNLVTDKLGGFRRSLSSKILNMGGLMKTVGGIRSRDKSEEKSEKENNCSLKGDKGDGREPEISGHLSSPSCCEHNTEMYPSEDGNVIKLSLGILQAAMKGDRSFIFAALLSTYSHQPYQEGMIQQYMAAKESLEVEQEPWQNRKQKEASSEIQVRKDTAKLDFSYMPKDSSTNCSSSFDPHVLNSIYPSTHSSIVPFSQLSLMPFVHTSLMVTRKLLAGSFSSFCFGVPSSATFSQYFPPTQDLPQIQHCISDEDSSNCPSEPIQEADARGSHSSSCQETPWDNQSSQPPMSHSSLDSKADIAGSQPRKCRVTSCNFYGHPETKNYCSCCYREELKRSDMEQDFHSS